MLLFVLAFAGGVLTILSPCILPVIPFVFARAGRPFRSSTLPMLAGMALTFALVAALATAGGHWVIRANEYGRELALGVMAVLGVTLLLPQTAEWLARPLVRLGARLQQRYTAPAQAGPASRPSAGTAAVLGVAVGLLWAPCAGPVLGLLLAAAALSGF
ncbi:MAG: cytochrome c biogenesis CcdA family protein, partial [Terriglobales bacterium]